MKKCTCVYATSRNSPSVRLGLEVGGYIMEECDYCKQKNADEESRLAQKFVSPCPQPTPYERELLEILIEECAEVTQRATKMLRFGVEEIQSGQSFNNASRLAMEYGDLREVAYLCGQAGLLPPAMVQLGRYNKRKQLAKYMQHTKEVAK